MRFVRVALDVPVNTLFDYRADSPNAIAAGDVVLVPFGKKIAVGVVMETTVISEVPSSRLRSILAKLPEVPTLPAEILSALRFCSDYYHHPIGEVVLNALPTRLRRRNAVRSNDYIFRLTTAGRGIDPSTLPARAIVRRTLLGRLAAVSTGISLAELLASARSAKTALQALIKLGWVEKVVVDAAPPAGQAPRLLPGPALVNAQTLAVDAIKRSFGSFTAWLLHGVTGSGKTEVYLELIARVLAEKKQALLLVPEINLTPQLESRVQARFPDTFIVRLHSGLNESARLNGWIAAQSGRAGIVLGTRLAVFTPLPRLGLIVVDEEHDPSFKQAEGLRYSARDIALLRAKQRAVPVVLGSATPSLETYQQALRGRYRMLVLADRVNAVMPVTVTTDIRGEKLIDGLAQPVLRAIQETIRRGEQSLIYINRRGFAPVLICPACSWTAGCPRCSAKLVVHLKRRQMHCHHCGGQAKIPANCPECGNAELAPLGQGTQRIEAAITRIFPAARVLRIDRDSTRNKGTWNEMRRQIHAREVDILVGTQMLAKGHDFPALTLVCVINADGSLYSTDYRASERLFANLMQVAGRAGRAQLPGRVLIQTEFPDHPLYAALRQQDFAGFARGLLAERKLVGLPPFSYQVILRAEAPQMAPAFEFLRGAANCLTPVPEGIEIYDPVPATMARLAGKERAQLTVQSRSRSALQAFLRQWVRQLECLSARKVRWVLDVDPQDP
jgi:primosomal protein N' (replication factor Y)